MPSRPRWGGERRQPRLHVSMPATGEETPWSAPLAADDPSWYPKKSGSNALNLAIFHQSISVHGEWVNQQAAVASSTLNGVVQRARRRGLGGAVWPGPLHNTLDKAARRAILRRTTGGPVGRCAAWRMPPRHPGAALGPRPEAGQWWAGNGTTRGRYSKTRPSRPPRTPRPAAGRFPRQFWHPCPNKRSRLSRVQILASSSLRWPCLP